MRQRYRGSFAVKKFDAEELHALPLACKWTLWEQGEMSLCSYKDAVRPLCSVATLGEFLALFNSLPDA